MFQRRSRRCPHDRAPTVSPVGVLGRVPFVEIFPERWHGEPFVAFLAMYVGDVEEGERVLRPLRELGVRSSLAGSSFVRSCWPTGTTRTKAHLIHRAYYPCTLPQCRDRI